MLDLDADMLMLGRQVLSGLPAVLGDIRHLPFFERFDTVVALGAVTAYLLDDISVECAAQALRSTLVRRPTARLLIDAYDSDTIHATNYFNGRGEWFHAHTRCTHTVETQHLSKSNGVFLTTLTIAEDRGSEIHSHRFQFRQRAFTGSDLAGAFEKQGLRLLDAYTDPGQGRLYQTYALV
ncbi:class I SAM-dependent methyltransferase [Trinickia symbiotica]|uniref:class I SAM-dependent methyltransferase n=1 Tax=Trinickia symbiotica TaxID=863227 RepID=UPI002158A562|nr:class I SAM-dependent methyltransferase [Trinickia symbiotica]